MFRDVKEMEDLCVDGKHVQGIKKNSYLILLEAKNIRK